jgi:HEAT repeat protein
LGLDPESRRHRVAVAWLTQHPSRSHPVLVRHLERRGPGWRHVPALLAPMGHPEGVPPLRAAMVSGDGGLAWDAAAALGRHPDPAASDALVAALSHGEPGVVQAALHGLAIRRDLSTCADLVAALDHPSGPVRYAALDAGLEMACVPEDTLDRMRDDPNPGVSTRARVARDAGRLAAASFSGAPAR